MLRVLQTIIVAFIWLFFLYHEVYGLGLTPDTNVKSYSPGIVLEPKYADKNCAFIVGGGYSASQKIITLEGFYNKDRHKGKPQVVSLWNLRRSDKDIRKKIEANEAIRKEIEAHQVKIQTIRTYPLPTAGMTDYFKATLEYYDYFKCDMGMNIISPVTEIEELRFNLILFADGDKDRYKVMAIDGIPNDEIVKRAIASGEVSVSISKALKFIPVVGNVVAGFLDVNLRWPFFLEKTVKKLDYYGQGTAEIMWYIQAEKINDFNASIIIRKKKEINSIKAEIRAFWDAQGYSSEKAEMRIFPLP